MTTSEVLRTLQREGLKVTASTLSYAMWTGRVTRPAQDGAGNFDWKESHLVELRAWFSQSHKPGRKFAEVE